MNFRIFLHII